MSVNYRSGHIFVCKLTFDKLLNAQRILPLTQVYQLKYKFVIIFVRNLLKFLFYNVKAYIGRRCTALYCTVLYRHLT